MNMDMLPPIEQHRLLSRPAPPMSTEARRLHLLRKRFELYCTWRQYDAEVYATECQLREQAAFLIEFMA